VFIITNWNMVKIKRILHRNQNRIGIFIAQNHEKEFAVRGISGSLWSKTLKC